MARFRVWVAFALLSLIWGSSYLFIRVGDRQLSPVALVALRLVIAAVAITPIVQIRRAPVWLQRDKLLTLIGIGSVNTALPFFLISWGEVTVPSGLASVLNSTVPIFSVLLAAVVLHDEPLTATRAGGVILGFAGVVLLLSRDLAHGGVHWSGIVAQGAIVLSSVCYAASAVLVRRTLRGTPSLTIGAYCIWVAALETGIASLVFSRPPIPLHPESIFAVTWLGVLGSALAYVLAFYILEEWGAGRYSLVAYMLPLTGLTLGVIFLGEVLDWRILAGSSLVITGVVLAGIVRRRRTAPAQVTQRPRPEAEGARRAAID